MAFQWLRRAGWLAAACAASLLLAACGSGTIESQLRPSRIISFGDAFADIGQNGARYSVNDPNNFNWTQVVATGFLLPLATSGSGGTSYATGNARVVAKPDAAGSTATRPVKEQVDAFLSGGAFGASDVILVGAGTSDIIAETASLLAGRQTAAQVVANSGAAGRELGGQVRRLVQAGAKQVVVVGPYNLGRSIWATDISQQTLLADATSRFNDQFLVSVVDLGANVLYIDAALYFNLVTGSPGSYGFANVTVPICSSVDPGPGIGTGAGQVNSNLCTSTTVAPVPATGAGAVPDAATYLFADRVYFTARAHSLFGQQAFNRIRDRW